MEIPNGKCQKCGREYKRFSKWQLRRVCPNCALLKSKFEAVYVGEENPKIKTTPKKSFVNTNDYYFREYLGKTVKI